MAQLENNPDVNWQQVQEIHDSWDYESQGLTGPAAVLVVIIVTYLTAGAGSGLAASAGGSAASGAAAAGASTATASAIGAAASAATTAVTQALINQTALSLINNQGNIGAVLKDLGSSSTIKNLATAALTAGALEFGGVNVATADGVSESLTEIGKQSVIKAGVDTAINGGSLGDNLANQLITGVVDAAAAETAGEIGDSTEAGSAANIIAHTALGCAAGAARGDDCGSGALGGAVGAVVSPIAASNIENGDGYLDGEEARDIAFTSEISAAVAALALGEDVEGAAQAAKNEVQNNYLSSWQKNERKKELAACTTTHCKMTAQIAWTYIDAKQDAGVIIGIGGGIGLSAYEMADALATAVLNPVDTYNGLKAVLTDPAVREQLGNDIVDSYEERLNRLSQARQDAGWDGSITNGVESGRLALEVVTAVQGVTALGKTLSKLPAGTQKVLATIKNSVKSDRTVVNDGLGAVISRADGEFIGQPHVFYPKSFLEKRQLTASEVNMAHANDLKTDYLPYKTGTATTERYLQPGEKFYSVEYPTQKAPGGWATPKRYSSINQVRRELALLPEFKDSSGGLVIREYTIKKPTPVRIGKVGELKSTNGKTYKGGGDQVEFLFDRGSRDNPLWSEYLSAGKKTSLSE